MLTSLTDIPIKKIPSRLVLLFAGLALLVVGCDIAGQQQNGGKDDTNEITFEAVDGLQSRITHADGSGSSNLVTASAKQAPGFELQSHVAPPTISGVSTVRASHMVLSDPPSGSGVRNLYIGYKVFGSGYGGGVDILDAPSGSPSADDLGPATSTGGDANALQEDDVDVQAVAVEHDGSGDPTALYVATAVQPDGGFSEAPQFHSISLVTGDGLPGSPVSSDSRELFSSNNTARIAKSVVAAPNNSTYNAFVISDVNTVHGVETTPSSGVIDNIDTFEASSGTLFRSITETSSGEGFALSDGGNIFEFSSLGLSQRTSSALGTIDSDFSIARISAHTTSEGEFLFVALNEGGFRVFDMSSNDVVFSDTEIFATAVTATTDRVYVANGDGFALYEVGSGLNNTDPDDGLTDVGRASLTDLSGIGSVPGPTDAQVNHILVDDSGSNPILYLAKSTDGVYKIEQTSSSPWN